MARSRRDPLVRVGEAGRRVDPAPAELLLEDRGDHLARRPDRHRRLDEDERFRAQVPADGPDRLRERLEPDRELGRVVDDALADVEREVDHHGVGQTVSMRRRCRAEVPRLERAVREEPEDEEGRRHVVVEFGETQEKGVRVRTFRRGRAFAVLVVGTGEDEDPEADALALRIGRGLAEVE